MTRWTGSYPYKWRSQDKKHIKCVLGGMGHARGSSSQLVREGFSEVSSKLIAGSRNRTCQVPRGGRTWGVCAPEWSQEEDQAGRREMVEAQSWGEVMVPRYH